MIDWNDFMKDIAGSNLELIDHLNNMLREIVTAQIKLKENAYVVVDCYQTFRLERIRKELNEASSSKNPVYFPEVKPKMHVTDDKSFGVYWRDYSNVAAKRRMAKVKGVEFDRRNAHGSHVRPLQKGYTERCFKKAPDWELELILKAEKEFQIIRDQTFELAKIGKSLRKLLKELDELAQTQSDTSP
ncbi:hypothetical protein J3998_03540 [Thiomicrorhabdus sp. 6S2-11]|uniref:Uncharacterized protein n=1 Tax=Thiomicrorhabdus marina TaxID=2818442 RepID=A0ABS3Q2U1_9GAMM|nr:conjugative transfer protein MobI(A/C) [Thiomicrorhabdus marina]MBO1926640.1 hypothetical protein [Thiomicrorhabdus marina]